MTLKCGRLIPMGTKTSTYRNKNKRKQNKFWNSEMFYSTSPLDHSKVIYTLHVSWMAKYGMTAVSFRALK